MESEWSTTNVHDLTLGLPTYSPIECIYHSTMLSGALNKTEKGNQVNRDAQSEVTHFYEFFGCKYCTISIDCSVMHHGHLWTEPKTQVRHASYVALNSEQIHIGKLNFFACSRVEYHFFAHKGRMWKFSEVNAPKKLIYVQSSAHDEFLFIITY